MFAEGRST
ncbi:hypothetical protein E2C01_100340 [Portunus trituberculatus]|uniref:Uncharacterized protein n=1 Tax=Portunus trituberculatus TaxID=210409 RepID=A0A5B7K2S8_PORTR|nr:hypothetical protein [Portunus trituberculatus]